MEVRENIHQRVELEADPKQWSADELSNKYWKQEWLRLGSAS